MKNRAVVFTLILAMLFSICGSNDADAKKKKVALNKKKITLTEGKSFSLKLKNNKKKVKWSSSKKKVATVSNKGKVKAKKKGTATITAKVGKKKYKCKVTVKAKTPKKNVSVQSPAPTDNSNTLEDIPKFVTFKDYSGEEIGNGMTTKSLFHTTKENTTINKKERLFLMLSYENKKRDSIVEIVLNDSDYGEKQIYTASASTNKILSSDTYYDSGKQSYITDVLLYLPETKDSSMTRTITIEECCFLRETAGVQGYADLSKARTTSVTFNVSSVPAPSSVALFDLVKNSYGGYTVTGLNSTYAIPEILYIPDSYQGLPVNELSTAFLGNSRVKKLIVPESVTRMRTVVTGNLGDSGLEEVYLLGKTAPKLCEPSGGINYLCFEDGTCKLIVQEDAVPQYIGDTRADTSWYWTYYHCPEKMYFLTDNDEIKPISQYVEKDDGDTGKDINDNIMEFYDGPNSEASWEAVKDSEGNDCYKLNFTGNNQDVFFKVPDHINLGNYSKVEITARVPEQMVFSFFGYNFSKDVSNWWSDSVCAFYPFENGSRSDSTPEGEYGIETKVYDISDVSDVIKYIRFGTNGTPAGGFENSPYYLYSIKFIK